MKNVESIFKFLVSLLDENEFEEIKNAFNDADNGTSDLEALVKNNTVYMDTCSFMYYNADKFLIKIVPILERWNKKIYTFSCCIREINKHINGNDKEKYEGALRAKDAIYRLKRSNLLQVIDYSSDTFADPDFLAYFTKKRINEKILFITQDGDLSIDAYKLNEQKSIKGQLITVKSIDKYGNLCDNYNLSDYIEEEEDDDDDDFYSYTDCKSVNFFNNNSGGINYSASNIKIDRIEVFDESNTITHQFTRRKNPNDFWHSIY